MNLPLNDFIQRVVTSTERVQFTHIDPYGHLNSARYTEYLINHRITAVEDQVGVATLDIAKELGVAFILARLDVRYVAPAYLGEELEIASWVESIQDSGFQLRLVVTGVQNRKVRALAIQEIRTVDFKTGRPVRCPETLPTRSESLILQKRPLKNEYIANLVNYQEI